MNRSQKCFKKWKVYSNERKKSRLNNKIAIKYYLDSLEAKTLICLKNNRNYYIINTFFNFWKKHVLKQYIKMDNLLNMYINQQKAKVFKHLIYRMRQRKHTKTLIQSLNNFKNIKFVSKYFLKLRKISNLTKGKRRLKQIIQINLMKKTLLGFKLNQKLIFNKNLKRGEAYEFYYFKLLRKGFYGWMPGCSKWEYEKVRLLRIYLYFERWKINLMNQLTKIQYKIEKIRNKLLIKYKFKAFKRYVRNIKKERIAKKFYKYQLFMAWKLSISIKCYMEGLKFKAKQLYSNRLKKKIIRSLIKNKTTSKVKSRILLENFKYFYKNSSSRLLTKYFTALKTNILFTSVEKWRNNQLIIKLFAFWKKAILILRLQKYKIKLFIIKCKKKLIKKSFVVLKNIQDILRAKSSIACQFRNKKILKWAIKEWKMFKIFLLKEKEKIAKNHFRTVLIQNAFYSLRLNKVECRQREALNKKIGWFMEKQDINVKSKVFFKLKQLILVNFMYNEKQYKLLNYLFYNLKLNTKLSQSERNLHNA